MVNELYTKRLGSKGPHLLMLHGWGQSSKNLLSLGEILSKVAQVHLIDLPGFGHSPPPEDTWSSFQYADHLRSYLQQQKIDHCILLGHSFGGKVAMSLAARYPQQVDQLILIAPSGLKRLRSFWNKMRFLSIKYLGRSLKLCDRLLNTELFQKHFVPYFGSADYQTAGAMRAVLVKSVNEDLSTEIASIKSHSLILWGAQDQETPVEMAHRLHRLIKNSQLKIFPEKDHHLFQDCGSHLCAAYILPFIYKQNL